MRAGSGAGAGSCVVGATGAALAARTRASRRVATAAASARATSSGARSAAQRSSGSAMARALREPTLDLVEPLAQLPVLVLECGQLRPVLSAPQRPVGLPPVDPHLAGAIDRRDQQPQLDR